VIEKGSIFKDLLISAFISRATHTVIKNTVSMLFLAVLVTIGTLCWLPLHQPEAAPPSKNSRSPGFNQNPAFPIVLNQHNVSYNHVSYKNCIISVFIPSSSIIANDFPGDD
jgi:hypothetical protein